MVAIYTGAGAGLNRGSVRLLGSQGQIGDASFGRSGLSAYVNAATGGLNLEVVDEILVGKGPDEVRKTQYDSALTSAQNWFSSDTSAVFNLTGTVNTAGSTITRVTEFNDWQVFIYDTGRAAYVFKGGAGAYDEIRYDGSTWSFKDGDTQRVDYFEHVWNSVVFYVSRRVDTDGNTQSFNYDANGNVTKITNADGSFIELNGYVNYKPSEVKTTYVNAQGVTTSLTRVHYVWDNSPISRLVSMVVDLSPEDNSIANGNTYVTNYTYDGSSQRVASISQQDGSLLQISYAEVPPGSGVYKVASYTQTVAAGVTRTTSFDYSVPGRTTVTDPAGQKTILFYDADKNLTEIAYPAIDANSTPRVVQFAYNANGDVISVVGGPGDVTTYGYDTNGNRILERDGAGNTISRYYGSKNELLTETKYLVPDPDGAGSGQPSSSLTTRYSYDGENHLRYAISATGMVTRYDYDAPGQQIAATDYTGNAYNLAGLADNASIDYNVLDSWTGGLSDKTAAQRTETTYDYRGNVATVSSYSKLLSTGQFDTSSVLSRTTYVYNSFGNLLSRLTNASSASEVFVYDGLGRQTMATDFNGAVTRSYFLDTLGQTVLTHANGLSEISTYDRAGELISFSQSNAGGNLVDLAGWPGNPGSVPSGQATVSGWQNWSNFTDETFWVSTTGPDGLPVVAMRAGQADATAEGGGNATNKVTIDPTKAYEFTYYFKFSDLDKHNIYFGLSDNGATAWVEDAGTGADNNNPYFYCLGAASESSIFTVNKWYKVVAYVLPQGAAGIAAGALGGIYDVATGQKLTDVTNYRWNPERPDNNVYSRFFNYYGDTSQILYSTYFYQPEIRQVSTPSVTGLDRSTSLYRYDNLGRLRMTVDPTGRRQYMMYDSVGRKVADIDADGSVTEYRYDGNDNVTSTTRYTNKLSSGQLASLVDANGNPTSATFASLCPTADAGDQWTWQVYDAAQRLVQTIDGLGATSVITYDGASRVSATTTYANRLSSTVLDGLKAEAVNPNYWAHPTDAAWWSLSNLTTSSAGTIDGASAFQLSVVAGGQSEAFAGGAVNVAAGDILSYTMSLKGVGSVTSDWLGVYGYYPSSWGNSNSYATIISGPGTLTQLAGSLFLISGLSTTEATRVTLSRRFLQGDTAVGYAYVKTADFSQVAAGNATIVAAPVVSLTHSKAANLPTADAANDRVSRNFYDADGRVVATMDAAGGLSQFVYDQAGRKVREIGSAKAVSTQTLRTTGTLAQLISDVGTSTSDRSTDYVYDARGFLRYTLDATSHPTKFTYDGAGRLIRTIEYAGSITPASSYSLTSVDNQVAALGLDNVATKRVSRIIYDAAGQVNYTIDAGGTVYAFAYDNAGNVVRQIGYATAYTTFTDDPSLATMQSWAAGHPTDPGNRFSRNVYDVHGRVAYTVDGAGYIVEHRYDAAGRVTTDIAYTATYVVADGVTKEALAAQIGALPSTAIVTTYAYDADGLVSDITRDISAGVTAVTHFTYDALGRAVDTTIAYGTTDASTVHRTYDGAGRVASETHAYGTAIAATTSYVYDAVGNLLTVTDARGYVTTRTYDMVGRVLTVTVPVDASSANDLVTVNQYDAFGDLVKVTDARGNTTFNYYDALGRVTLQSDAERFITQTSYTTFGEVYQVTRRAARGTGTPTVTAPPTIVTGSDDATTTFAYDKMGRLATVTDAMGYSENYYYDAFGEHYAVYNKLNSPTSYGYTNRGQLYYQYDYMPVYRPDGTAQASANYTSLLQYDAQGHVIQKTEGYGLTERRDVYYYYDKGGRLVTVAHTPIQLLGTDLSTVTTYSPYESYAYNLRGDLIQSVDPASSRTLSWYDALGRKTDEVTPVGTLTHWTYDANGNVLTARVYGDAIALPGAPGGTPPAPVNAGNYRETSYTYDRANRLVSTTVAALKSAVFDGTSYVTTYSGAISTGLAYDKNGNVVRETDGIGYANLSWYDALDRKVAQTDREGYLTTWTRDANGNAVTETRYANQIAAYYNETRTVAEMVALAGTNAADRTTAFTYDKNGHRLTETRQNVAASSVSGNSVTTSTVNATITYTYNALGQVTSKAQADGDLTTYIYDNMGRLITTKGATMVDNAGTTIRLQSDFYYDGLGDLVRTVQHGDVYANAPDRVATSIYGAGGQLLSTADTNGFVRNYGYDVNGRVIKESWTRMKSDGTTVTEATTYRYDLAGRLVTQAAATWNGSAFVFGDATRTRYDAYGEVTGRGITGGPNDTAVYQEVTDYDAGGRAWRTTAGDGTIKIMFYDKAGNATLTLSSTGADLSGYTYDSAMATLTAAGGTSIANAVTTIAVFDKRGEQLQSLEPSRQLTASTSATVTTSRAYNAFGEVTSETDARSNTTTYSYNAMGRLTQKVSPIVNWTGENGAIHTSDHPTENYYYDISGRLVGVRDANSNLTTRVLEAGTGHDGGEALVHVEYHADGGYTATWHNVFGDARLLYDELGRVETRDYDNMGRIVTIAHRGNLLYDYYGYDGLGQRITHYNSQLTSAAVERTDYDVQGRVVLQTDMAGTATTTSYMWVSYLSTTGLGSFGAWQKTTTAAGHSAQDNSDYFGRTISRSDLGGHTYAYTFDKGGRLTALTNSAGASLSYSYFNTGRAYTMVENGVTATYGYDAAGNKTAEAYGSHENATATYDALNRLTHMADTGEAGTAPLAVDYEYDLNGNVRHMAASFTPLAAGTASTQDYWYRYDAMDRIVTTMGTFSGSRGSGTIGRGQVGTDITWDAASQRMTETQTLIIMVPNVIGYSQYGPIFGPPTPTPVDARRYYSYGNDGYLATYSQYVANPSNPNAPATAPSGSLVDSYTRDAMGRVTTLAENGTTTTSVYNARSQVTSQSFSGYGGSSTTTYDYNLESSPGSGVYTGAYQGVLTHSHTTPSSGSASDSTKSYVWWDSAEQSVVTNSGGSGSATSTYGYDNLGHVASVAITGANAQTVNFVTDPTGQVVQRTGSWQVDRYSYFDGKTIGYVSNSAVYQRFNNTLYADFDQNYAPVASSAQGADATYTVQGGDTLRTVAQNLWGDAGLWYLIADANGLNGSETLAAGTVLTIPAKVTNLHNNADTFKVYDPNKAWGDNEPIPDASPLQPTPPKHKGGCGIVGQILMIAVAVAVAYALPHLAPFLLKAGILGAMATGAVASAVSQGVGIAIGAQDKFSFKGVAMAALTAGITKGVGGGQLIKGAGSFVNDVARGALVNSLTQGVGVATGLQDKFNWAGVAAAGITSGVSGLMARVVPGSAMPGGNGAAYTQGNVLMLRETATFGNRLASGMAGALAGAAARSLIEGSSFGDNIMASLPDVIGSTIGNMLGERISGVHDRVIGWVDRANPPPPLGAPPPPPPADVAALQRAGWRSAWVEGQTAYLYTGAIGDMSHSIAILAQGGDPRKIASIIGHLPPDILEFLEKSKIDFAAVPRAVTEYRDLNGREGRFTGTPTHYSPGGRWDLTVGSVAEHYEDMQFVDGHWIIPQTVVIATEGGYYYTSPLILPQSGSIHRST